MTIKRYSLSLQPDIVGIIDKIRGNIPRSKAIDTLLAYMCTNEDTIKAIIPKPISFADYLKANDSIK